MFAIHNKDIYDSVESVYSCTTHGTFYCKYADNPYKVIDTDEERTHLMNNFYEIHEMIHITDSYTEVIYHDRYGDSFVTLSVDPTTFNHIEHMADVDFLFIDYALTNDIDDIDNKFHLSSKHIDLIFNRSYKIGEFE